MKLSQQEIIEKIYQNLKDEELNSMRDWREVIKMVLNELDYIKMQKDTDDFMKETGKIVSKINRAGGGK